MPSTTADKIAHVTRMTSFESGLLMRTIRHFPMTAFLYLISWRNWAITLVKKDGFWAVRYKLLMKSLPLLNFIYELFLGDHFPSTDGVKSILDVFAILNGLLLSGGSGLMASVTMTDLRAADNLYYFKTSDNSTSTQNLNLYWHTYYSVPPSNQLYFDLSTSLSCFFVSILMIVYVYIDMMAKVNEVKDDNTVTIAKDPERDTVNADVKKGKKFKNMAQDKFEKWWGWSSYAVMILMCLTIFGCLYIVLSVNVLFAIKYPDYHLEQYGTMTKDFNCPTGYALYISNSPVYGCCTFAVFMCGFGTSAMYWEIEEYDRLMKNDCPEKLTKISPAESKNAISSLKSTKVSPEEANDQVQPFEDV